MSEGRLTRAQEAFRTPVQRFAFRRRGDACPISLTPYRILRLGRLACRVFLGVSAAGQRDDHAEFHGPCVMHHHQWFARIAVAQRAWADRSEERRVGEECVGPCRSRGSAEDEKKKQRTETKR